MRINLFIICKSDKFIVSMEQLLNKDNIFISGICKDLSRGFIEFKNSSPRPDLVLLDAYWATGTSKDILTEFLLAKIKVILTTNYLDQKILDYFLPLQPQGYIFRTCDSFKMITDCIYQVFLGEKCIK